MDSRIWKVIIAVAALHVLVLGSMFLIQHGCKQTSKEPGLAQPEPAPPLPPVAPTPPQPGSVAQPGTVTTITPGTPVVTQPTTMVAPTPAPTPAPQARTYVIKQGDTLGKVAKTEGVTLDSLLAANPGIDPKKLRIGQEIHVPTSGGAEVAGAAVASEAAMSTAKTAANVYTVKKGDTLGGIAKSQGTTVTAIKKANKLSSDSIRVGQKLKIPSPHDSGQRPPREAAAAKSDLAATGSTMGDGTTHIVQSGETPEIIAKKYGVSTKALLAANGNPNPKKLKVGQKLVIPTKVGETAPAATAAPVVPATSTVPGETVVTDTPVSGQAVAPPVTLTPSETMTPPAGR